MRQQAMEALLKRFEKASKRLGQGHKEEVGTLLNLTVKSEILRSRRRDASVIRELVNGN